MREAASLPYYYLGTLSGVEGMGGVELEPSRGTYPEGVMDMSEIIALAHIATTAPKPGAGDGMEVGEGVLKGAMAVGHDGSKARDVV
jgi:hypothetical protein